MPVIHSGPTVSFVVTLYNKQEFLPYLLASIAAQSGGFAREFIFVDDGSTDRTVPLLRAAVADWPAVTILEQPNAGPAVALNRGFRAATGDFVKPIDGDDVLLPWATERLLAASSDTGSAVSHADLGLQGRYDLAMAPERLLALQRRADGPYVQIDRPLRVSLAKARTNPSAILVRTDLVRAVGGCDEAVFVQDYSLELRLAARGAFARVDELILLRPRTAPGRLSDNEAQTLHDINLALAGLLRAEPGLSNDLRRYALRRASGRAWAWARRRGGKNVLSRDFARYFAARLNLASATSATIEATCDSFTRTAQIRVVGGG